MPSDVDPRQMSLFAAAWTVGSLAWLAASANIHSLTYYETTGWKGLMEEEQGASAPRLFHYRPGSVFPAFHALADVADFQWTNATVSSHPLEVEALALINDRNQRRILVANLTEQTQAMKVQTGGGQARVRTLDETNALEAMDRPESFRENPGELQEAVGGKLKLTLRPFAVARIDLF